MPIADDGVGLDATQPHPGHFGLQSMSEQAALIGARMVVHGGRCEGTRIELALDS